MGRSPKMPGSASRKSWTKALSTWWSSVANRNRETVARVISMADFSRGSTRSWQAHYEEVLRIKRRACSVQVTMRFQEALDSLGKAADSQRAGDGARADGQARAALVLLQELSDWVGLEEYRKELDALVGVRPPTK